MELSERNIKAAMPGDVLRDATIKGLHLRVTASGKSFLLYYRTKAGQERRPKLGEYGSITLAQARKVAQELLTEVAAGRDPSQARADARAEPTVTDLWSEYWKRHASRIKSGSTYARQWRIHVEPRFGRMKAREVTYAMIADMHEAMVETPAEANRVLAFLSGMFNFGRRPLKWVSENPVEGVKRYPEVKRRRYMKGEEAARIAEVLDASAKDSPESVAFLYLLILTGARRGEIANAKWEWLRGNVIHLPDSKTGEKQVYLPPAALDVLDRLPRTSGTITGILTPQKLWERVRREAGCPDLRMHDLRHSFASAALSAGLSLSQIGELLGHASTQTTKRYAHLVDEVATAAATATADQILGQIKKAREETRA
jgi:integrase